MLHKTLKLIPRLTQHMLDLLIECHERELMQKAPCDIGNTSHAQGLLRRKLLDAKKFTTETGKQIMGLFVTDLGRKYLSSL
ncbi:MAG TPA: hypothetical protein VMY77_08260 [Chitinophagaceae bacterium]|nr:hypothetical protein [Chitinophagaceae bacterium]